MFKSNFGGFEVMQESRWSGQVRSECLTCTFRASCCSARLSGAQEPAFASSSVWDREIKAGGSKGVPPAQAGTRERERDIPNSITPHTTLRLLPIPVGLLVLPCNPPVQAPPPLIPSPFFSSPGQRNRQRPVLVPVTSVRYNSLL